MTPLEFTFTNDLLFKMLFTQNQDLLKHLVSQLLNIGLSSIEDFHLLNPEILPENLGDKFCRFDINMTVNGQLVDLEIQVKHEADYPERVLFYWAKEFSSGLDTGKKYSDLPCTIIISIMSFELFNCNDYHSEYQVLDTKRHTPLTDRLSLHFFELPKVPPEIDKNDELKLWLFLFKAKTLEELEKIEALEVAIMNDAINAYHKLTARDSFKEMERLFYRARMDEGSALQHARDEINAKWQLIVADKDAALADKDAALADKDAALAERDAIIAAKDALIAEFMLQQEKNGKNSVQEP